MATANQRFYVLINGITMLCVDAASLERCQRYLAVYDLPYRLMTHHEYVEAKRVGKYKQGQYVKLTDA